MIQYRGLGLLLGRICFTSREVGIIAHCFAPLEMLLIDGKFAYGLCSIHMADCKVLLLAFNMWQYSVGSASLHGCA